MQDETIFRDLLPSAIQIANEAHAGTINKDGTNYIEHPIRLMMQAGSDLDKIVAVLHDTIEDTNVTLDALRAEGFPSSVVDAVDALSKRPQEANDYEAFIDRIALNPCATRIKLLDLYDNIDTTRLDTIGDWELARTAKYHKAIQKLKAVAQRNQLEDGFLRFMHQPVPDFRSAINSICAQVQSIG